MEKSKSFLTRILDGYSEIIAIIIAIVVIVFFVRHKISDVNANGVITVAKILRYEGAESGSNLYIEIYLEDRKITTSINKPCPPSCIGSYYFVKVKANDPVDYPIFYDDKQVPDCIVANVKYFKGWNYFPDCGNY
jgi:hypothetical protein